MKFLKFLWRKIYLFFQRNIPKHHNSLILKNLNKLSIIFHECYENKNYNINTNGEALILRKLYSSNNLKFIFDIGANKGDYSILSRKISPNAKIFAFEPVSSTFQSLQKKVRNLEVHSYNFAFGKKDGFSSINVFMEDTLSSILSFQNQFLNKEFKKEKIQIKKGNTFLHENAYIKEISILKIDTEGFENSILEGFDDYFQKVNVIQFEYGLANLSSK